MDTLKRRIRDGGTDMARYEYKTVDTSTLKGLRQAERLHQRGWTMGSSGLFTIQFYKRIKERQATASK